MLNALGSLVVLSAATFCSLLLVGRGVDVFCAYRARIGESIDWNTRAGFIFIINIVLAAVAVAGGGHWAVAAGLVLAGLLALLQVVG